MSKLTTRPSASRHLSLVSHTPHKDYALLTVSYGPQIEDFLKLLELIYDAKPDVKGKDLSGMWVRVNMRPHHTLAGARVAARACNIDYEVAYDIPD